MVSRRGLVAGTAGLTALFVLASRDAARAAVVWRHPFIVRGGVTSYFGNGHNGLDYGTPGDGSPIYSVASGTVAGKSFDSTLGHQLVINHADGFSSMYAHMAAASMLDLGLTYPVSTLIGNVGDTGVTSGPHLHIEIRQGSRLNPYTYVHNAPLAVPNNSGDDVPYLNAIDWVTPTAVTETIGSTTWTRLPRAATPSYDLAAVLGGAGLWNLEVNLWISGLVTGEVLVVRVGTINTPTHYTQVYYPVTVEGTTSGTTKTQYTSTIRVQPSTSVVLEVQGSGTGIVVDEWHARVLNWQA